MWFLKKSVVTCTYRKEIWILQSKSWGAQGAIISKIGDGFGKKLIEMAGSTRDVPSILYTFWHWGFQSYIPPTEFINFVCQTMKLCWRLTNVNATFAKFLTNRHPPEDKTGCCCLWAFFPPVTKAVENKGASQGLIRACQGWCLNWSADSESRKEAYRRQGWRVGWLAQGHHLLEFNPSSPSGQAARCGAWKPEGPGSGPPPFTVWPQVNFTICAAISPSFKQMVCLCTSSEAEN